MSLTVTCRNRNIYLLSYVDTQTSSFTKFTWSFWSIGWPWPCSLFHTCTSYSNSFPHKISCLHSFPVIPNRNQLKSSAAVCMIDRSCLRPFLSRWSVIPHPLICEFRCTESTQHPSLSKIPSIQIDLRRNNVRTHPRSVPLSYLCLTFYAASFSELSHQCNQYYCGLPLICISSLLLLIHSLIGSEFY